MRILLGGILGGFVLFGWGAVSHMATPLGEIGMRMTPVEQEAEVVQALRGAMSERAIYFFPGIDMRQASEQELADWQRKVEAGPSGIVVFNPGAGVTMSGKFLGMELLLNVLEALIASLIVANLAPSSGYWKRVLVVAGIGLAAALSIDGSYWNWYSFPTSYFAAQLLGNTTGALLAGLAIAGVVRPTA